MQDRWLLPEVRPPKIKWTRKPALAVFGALCEAKGVLTVTAAPVSLEAKTLGQGKQVYVFGLIINFICELGYFCDSLWDFLRWGRHLLYMRVCHWSLNVQGFDRKRYWGGLVEVQVQWWRTAHRCLFPFVRPPPLAQRWHLERQTKPRQSCS